MTRNRKVAVSVGALALLLGIGVNMQVSALNPDVLKNNVIQRGVSNPKDNVNTQVSPDQDKTDVKVKDVEIWVGDEWKAEDNFVESITGLGHERPFRDVTVEGYVDTKTAGIYYITYWVYNCSSEKVEAKAMVTVKKDRTSIKVKNSTLKIGAKWKAEDNYVESTTGLGGETSFKEVMVNGTVNTAKAGKYQVVYSVYNCKQKKLTATATITVKGGSKNTGSKGNGSKKKHSDKTSIKVKNSTIYVGQSWTAIDNFVSGTNKDGKSITIKQVMISGDVNNKEVGINKITYYTINRAKKKVSRTAIIKVIKDQTNLVVKDSTLNLGDEWTTADNLVSATDKDGKDTDIKDIDVKGSVDTTKAGNNEVIYTVVDSGGRNITKKAIVTVKDKDNGDNNNNDSKDNNNNDSKDNNDDNGNKDTGDNKNDNKGDNTGIGGGPNSGNNGNAQLPKTGYDVSIITVLIGLAGALGAGSIYLKRRQDQE